ncbi:MAG: hypothetical protein ABIU06_12305 [Anaerolineales bacterium]
MRCSKQWLAKISHRHFCWRNIGYSENGILIPVNDVEAPARAAIGLLRIHAADGLQVNLKLYRKLSDAVNTSLIFG